MQHDVTPHDTPLETPTMTTNTVAKADRFTKGDRVTLFGSWDNKGTFFFTQATVYSCGGKQMVLTAIDTGAELGRHFAPNKAQPLIVPQMSDDEARTYAITLAADFLVRENAHFDNCIARNSYNSMYCAAITESRNRLHEPCAYKYAR